MQLTPPQVMSRLYDMHQQLASNQDALRMARDAEVEAVEKLRVATAAATLSPACPSPKRGENGVTVADRNAWVDNEVADVRFKAAVAEATRKAAEDCLRVTRDQASLVQSLAAMMRAEAQLAGAVPG